MLAIRPDGKKKITFTDLLICACSGRRGCPWASRLLLASVATSIGKAKPRRGSRSTRAILGRR